MAQKQKEYIRQNIILAATIEFKEKGFEKAKMKTISSNAGISIGNLYRYFKSKKDLFEYIVEPIFNKLMIIIESNKSYKKEINLDEISKQISILIQDFTNFYVDNNDTFFLLINSSKGTKYQDVLQKIKNSFEKKFYRGLSNINIDKSESLILSKAMAAAVVNGYFEIINNCNKMDDAIFLIKNYGELLLDGFKLKYSK